MPRARVLLLTVAMTVAAAVSSVAAVPALATSGHDYVQIAKLAGDQNGISLALPPELASYGTLGASIAVSADGKLLVAGDPALDEVLVFIRPANGVWKNAHAVIALHRYPGALYPQDVEALGTSVAVSADGSTIVAGAPYASTVPVDGQPQCCGAVDVYTEPAGGWQHANGLPMAEFTEKTPSAWDALGASVAIDAAGNAIVAGSPNEAIPGSIYLFTKPRTGWGHAPRASSPWFTAETPGGNSIDGNEFGESIAMSADGDTIAVGAPDQQGFEGAVYVVKRYANGGFRWHDMEDPATGSADSYFDCTGADGYGIFNPNLGTGVSISANGRTIVAGDPCAGTGGQAVVYADPRGGWLTATGQFTAGLTPPRIAAAFAQQDGNAVAISADADVVLADDPAFELGPGGFVDWVSEPARGWSHVNPPNVADFGEIEDPVGAGQRDQRHDSG